MPSAVININATEDIVVAPGEGMAIRVLALVISASVAEQVQLKSGSLTQLTGPMRLAANAPMVWPYSASGYVQCAENQTLRIEQVGSAELGGVLVYAIVPV